MRTTAGVLFILTALVNLFAALGYLLGGAAIGLGVSAAEEEIRKGNKPRVVISQDPNAKKDEPSVVFKSGPDVAPDAQSTTAPTASPSESGETPSAAASSQLDGSKGEVKTHTREIKTKDLNEARNLIGGFMLFGVFLLLSVGIFIAAAVFLFGEKRPTFIKVAAGMAILIEIIGVMMTSTMGVTNALGVICGILAFIAAREIYQTLSADHGAFDAYQQPHAYPSQPHPGMGQHMPPQGFAQPPHQGMGQPQPPQSFPQRAPSAPDENNE